MLKVRIGPELRRRVDPEDAVQEVLTEAVARSREWADREDLPLAVWLRLLAQQKLSDLFRRHLGAEARDVRRERHEDAASTAFADHLIGHATSPSGAVARKELRDRLLASLREMPEPDREILLLRHFEQLSGADAARVLGLERSAASKRYFRALQRLREALVALGIEP